MKTIRPESIILMEEFEKFLTEEKRKKNGDSILDSTIERYSLYVSDYLPELNIKETITDMVAYMNLLLKTRQSQLVKASFQSYIQMRFGKDVDLKSLGLITIRNGATADSSIRFLQKKVLSQVEIKKIYENSKSDFHRLIFSFCYDSACRQIGLQTVRRMDVSMMNEEKPEDKKKMEQGIYAEVILTEKGEKSRTVYLTQNTVELLQKHIIENNIKPEDRLFVLYKDKENKIEYESQHNEFNRIFQHYGLAKDGSKYTMKKDNERVEIEPVLRRHLTMHCWRHTKATHLADEGCDILGIKNYLGHEDLKTTQIYLEISSYQGRRAWTGFSRDILGRSIIKEGDVL